MTRNFPKHELYGLVSQLRHAAISVCSNISEGSAWTSKKERMRFYEIARSSIVEIDTQIIIAYKLGYIEEKDFIKRGELLNRTFAMTSSLIKRQ
jgi:four helix bundle protein